MTTPAKKNIKNKEHVNRKKDKILNRITKSPNKQHQENEQQLISIIPTDHTTPTEQLMSIIPAHQSTPSEQRQPIKATTRQEDLTEITPHNNQLVTHKQSTNTNAERIIGTSQLVIRSPEDNNRNDQQQNPASPGNIPEDRQHPEEPTEKLHMEEYHDYTTTLSSISSLNTEDIEALDKISDSSQDSERGKCGG